MKAPAIPSNVVRMNPVGLLAPGAKIRAMMAGDKADQDRPDDVHGFPPRPDERRPIMEVPTRFRARPVFSHGDFEL